MPPDALLIVQTLIFSRSYLHRQVSPPETLVVKGGTTWARNDRWILPQNARLPRNIQGSFTCRKSTTWDKRLYFPSEGKRAEDFFALKNPTVSVGFEPANLGTKCQHATSRPAKPLSKCLTGNSLLRRFKLQQITADKTESKSRAHIWRVHLHLPSSRFDRHYAKNLGCVSSPTLTTHWTSKQI